MTLSAFSFGGGWQSVGALVLQAQGELGAHFDHWLFANVGDDSEHPGTIRYFYEHALPYADRHGIDLQMLHRMRRDGTIETLHGRLTKPGSRSLDIPVRMANGAPGNRSCTGDFKINVIGRWLKQHGATPTAPATVGVGISTDEAYRMNQRKVMPYERVTYPLIDKRLSRSDLGKIIRRAGLPIPPRSACYFCPFQRLDRWIDMRRDEPELFDKAAALEDQLNTRRDELGKDHVFLTRFAKPLRQVVPEGVEMLPFELYDEGDGMCDNGACMT